MPEPLKICYLIFHFGHMHTSYMLYQQYLEFSLEGGLGEDAQSEVGMGV